MKRRGSVVVDAAIVIGLIALVFVTAIFPALTRDREIGREATCQSFVKDIVRAQIAYAQDNDERLPIAQKDESEEYVVHSIYYLIGPYNLDPSRYRCPSAIYNYRKPLRGSWYPTYGFRSESTGTSLKNISNLQTCPITLDLGGVNELFSFVPVVRRDGVGVTALFKKGEGFEYSHPKGVNIGFADGHVKEYYPFQIPGLLFPNQDMGSSIKSDVQVKCGEINIWTNDRVAEGERLKVIDEKGKVLGTATVSTDW